MVVGHREQLCQIRHAMNGGRLHHAWLFTGPRGIGKRQVADRVAIELLGEGAEALIQAGAHPDFRVLTPPETGKGSSTGSILVDQLRDLSDFLHSHPAFGGHRVLIVDSIDDLNRNAANAFLKELEEPRPGSLFLLISHAPRRLLPTIRSRCRTLRFGPLADSEVAQILAVHHPELEPATREALVRLSAGVPGRALALARGDLAGLQNALEKARLDPGQSVALARSLQGTGGAERLQSLMSAILAELADQARTQPSAEHLHAYAQAAELARDVGRLAHDRAQVALALSALLARADQD